MKHMLNLLVLLSLSLAVHAAPGGPSISEVEGETGSDVKASAATKEAIEQMITDKVIKPKNSVAMKAIKGYAAQGLEYAEQEEKAAEYAARKARGEVPKHMGYMGHYFAKNDLEKMEKAEGAPADIMQAMKAYGEKSKVKWMTLKDMAEKLSKKLPPPLPPLPVPKKPEVRPLPRGHVNVEGMDEVLAISLKIQYLAKADAEIVDRILEYLAAYQQAIETHMKMKNQYNVKAMMKMNELRENTSNTDERLLYESIMKHMDARPNDNIRLERIKSLIQVAQDAKAGK